MSNPPPRPKTSAPLSESKRIKPNKQSLKKEEEEALRDKLKNAALSGNDVKDWEIAYKDIVCCDLLGTGTSGDVYSGTWNNKRCAIKVLKVFLPNFILDLDLSSLRVGYQPSTGSRRIY